MAITVLHWNRLSDRLGRKPVLLMGMFGSVASILCLGLSRTFLGLVARYAVRSVLPRQAALSTPSLSLWGLLDGNVGQLTDVDVSFYNLMEYHRRHKERCRGNHGLDESVPRLWVVFRPLGGRGKSRVRSSSLFLPRILIKRAHT